MNRFRVLLLGSGLVWALASPAVAEPEVLTAVFSQTHHGCARTKLPDGSLKPETYAFGDGGYESGRLRDESIDGFSFPKLARFLSPYLAGQG